MKRITRIVLLTLCSSALLGQTTPGNEKPEVETKESQAAMTPAAAIGRLEEGNRRFVANATKQRD